MTENEKLKEPQKNTGKYKSFVYCFADGWFNCETPGASKLYVISNPSMVLFRNMSPSKAITVGGLPISFPPEFEPVFLSGVVFYADSF